MVENISVKNVADVPLDPAHSAWHGVAPTRIGLFAQKMVAPHGGGDVDGVDVRLLASKRHFAVRLEWDNPTREDAIGLRRFRDGCAIMFPAVMAREPPAAIMGSKDNPVVIWHWKPDWENRQQQAAYREEHYPQYGDTYNPHNERLWNNRGDRPAGGEAANVVVAEGFGTVTRTIDADLEIKSWHGNGKTSVVFRHPLPISYPAISAGAASLLNVAVWDGAQDEVGCRKSVSFSWQPFSLAPSAKAVAKAGAQLANPPVVLASLSAAAVAWVIRRRMRIAEETVEAPDA